MGICPHALERLTILVWTKAEMDCELEWTLVDCGLDHKLNWNKHRGKWSEWTIAPEWSKGSNLTGARVDRSLE